MELRDRETEAAASEFNPRYDGVSVFEGTDMIIHITSQIARCIERGNGQLSKPRQMIRAMKNLDLVSTLGRNRAWSRQLTVERNTAH